MGATPPPSETYFSYFPDDYRWSMAFLLALGSAPFGGADVGEVHAVGRRLRDRYSGDDEWFREWSSAGSDLLDTAEAYLSDGKTLTAASTALRACNYLQAGERFRLPKDDMATEIYRRSLRAFEIYAEHNTELRIERVGVPYQAGSLSAYQVQPAGRSGRPAPYVVFFDGLDLTKELLFLRGVREIARRGIGVLVLDGPGNGESIRFGGHVIRYDYEVAASAAYEFLAGQAGVAESQVGVVGLSLGGYFAARSAAKDSRFAACVVWGALWDYYALWQKRLAASGAANQFASDHLRWVLDEDTFDGALAKLQDWNLAGVADAITMPLLVLHGGDDRQASAEDADRVHWAAASPDKTLITMPAGAPGDQHCQLDSPLPAIELIADWLSVRLAAR
jgi:alpha-beta hydrolase superfamily lysophospholipase